MATNPFSKLAALIRGQVRRAAVYHVGVMLRWRWLVRSITPLLEGRALSVLDAGSGSGWNAFRLARRYPQATWLGVEINPDHVRRCQAQVREDGLTNLAFVQGDLTQAQGTERFDLIYSIDVIEHIDEDRLALRNLAQALRPGGHLLLHTPLAPQRHWFRRFDLGRRVQPLHVREGYTVDDLQAKVRETGLTPTAVIYTHGRWGTLAWELWRLVEDHRLASLVMRIPVELLVAVELARPPRWGNCVLIEAVKPGTG